MEERVYKDQCYIEIRNGELTVCDRIPEVLKKDIKDFIIEIIKSIENLKVEHLNKILQSDILIFPKFLRDQSEDDDLVILIYTKKNEIKYIFIIECTFAKFIEELILFSNDRNSDYKFKNIPSVFDIAYIDTWIKYGMVIYEVYPKEHREQNIVNQNNNHHDKEIDIFGGFVSLFERLIDINVLKFDKKPIRDDNMRLAFQISRILCDFYHTRLFHSTQDVINIPNPSHEGNTIEEIPNILKKHYREYFSQIAILHRTIHDFASKPFYFYFDLLFMRKAQDAIKLAIGNMIFAISYCNFFPPIYNLQKNEQNYFIKNHNNGRVEILQSCEPEKKCKEKKRIQNAEIALNDYKNEYIRRFQIAQNSIEVLTERIESRWAFLSSISILITVALLVTTFLSNLTANTVLISFGKKYSIPIYAWDSIILILFMGVFFVALTIVFPIGYSYLQLRVNDFMENKKRERKKKNVINSVETIVHSHLSIGRPNPIGRWQEIGGTEIVEFLRDNRISILNIGQSYTGSWTKIDYTDTINMDVTVLDKTVTAIAIVKGDNLRINKQVGEEGRVEECVYEKVRSF